jgi:Fe-S cluster assembly protein SufD
MERFLSDLKHKRQSNQNINLSDEASIYTKPQLEIWADDVKCSHGCTVGQMDEEALFYLRARGIGKNQAKALILIAFAKQSLEYIPFEFVKEEIDTLIRKRLIG